MIPRKLQIKNFLSYGPKLQTIDFESHHLICLSGKNGHGKSALLDALTWALWGQARKVFGAVKPDDGLLHLGQTQMMVCFDFIFNNITYRVRREYTKTRGKPLAHLDFGVIDPETEELHSLTDKTLRTTQAKIESTIGLDFESFINSAFLRQGQSNEFSKKSAKERKEVLATILGLDRYEQLRKKAMERSRQAITEKQGLTKLHESLTEKIAQKESINELYKKVSTQIKEIHKQEESVAKQLKELAQRKQEYTAQQQQLSLLEFQHKQLSETAQAHEEKIVTTLQHWRTVHRQSLTTINQHALEVEKKELDQQQALFNAKLQQRLELQNAYAAAKELYQQVLQKQRHNYQIQLHTLKLTCERAAATLEHLMQQQANIEKQIALTNKEHTELTQQITTLKQQQTSFNSLQKVYTQEEQQFERRKSYYTMFTQRCSAMSQQLKELEHKQHLATTSTTPCCPLCGQDLSSEHKQSLHAKLTQEQNFVAHQYQRLTHVLQRLKEVLTTQRQTVEHHKKERDTHYRAATVLQEREKAVAQIAQRLKEHQQLLQTVCKDHTHQTALHKSSVAQLKQHQEQESAYLEACPEYQRCKKELAAIEQKGKKLAYNKQEHQAVIERLSLVTEQLASAEKHHHEQARQSERAQRIHEEIVALRATRKKNTECTQQMAPFAKLKEQEKNIVDREHEITTHHKKVLQEKEQAVRELGRLEQEQKTIKQHTHEIEQHQGAIQKLEHTILEYQAIAAALSKDGIQALLIEDALPEIEHEANELLGKLTDNQTHVFIESLRDLKKGGSKETLDIKISDPMGLRPYELFSGGEAFRIDFALRIAISKLLARRAGTSLQTLIIDEGFGSQDEDGLSHIMDAIYKIQDDFEKVIIVSHLTSMKDQFPVHFVVSKGTQGSTLAVVEQG